MGSHEYIGYGLNIKSDYPLIGAQPGSHSNLPTVSIHRARPDFDWAGLMSRNNRGDFLLAHLDDVLHFWVENGESITMTPDKNADPEEAEFLIRSMSAGFALALLLRQRGLLVLHASILQKGGHTIGFVGESGWGKSTLAEYFSQNGYDVLTDDVGALDVRGETVFVVPGHAFVKLRRGATNELLCDVKRVRRCPDGRVHLKKSSSVSVVERIPLDSLYLLRPASAEKTTLEAVSPQKAVLELMQRTHGAHLLTREDYQARLLSQCTGLVKNVQVFSLRREWGMDKLNHVLDVVEESLSANSAIDDESAKAPEAVDVSSVVRPKS